MCSLVYFGASFDINPLILSDPEKKEDAENFLNSGYTKTEHEKLLKKIKPSRRLPAFYTEKGNNACIEQMRKIQNFIYVESMDDDSMNCESHSSQFAKIQRKIEKKFSCTEIKQFKRKKLLRFKLRNGKRLYYFITDANSPSESAKQKIKTCEVMFIKGYFPGIYHRKIRGVDPNKHWKERYTSILVRNWVNIIPNVHTIVHQFHLWTRSSYFGYLTHREYMDKFIAHNVQRFIRWERHEPNEMESVHVHDGLGVVHQYFNNTEDYEPSDDWERGKNTQTD